ncbi:hypothetical protein AMTRI_Chr03g142840 [Amborella trichopoda]
MWTYQMGNYLVEQLLKQVQLGRRVDNDFKCEAYNEICEEFEKVNGIALSLENAYPRAKMCRTKSIPFFSSLPIVLGDDRADGRQYDIESDSEGGDDHDIDELMTSISCVGEAIPAFLIEITFAFGNTIEELTKKTHKFINNHEFIIELERVEGHISHDYFRAVKYLMTILNTLTL